MTEEKKEMPLEYYISDMNIRTVAWFLEDMAKEFAANQDITQLHLTGKREDILNFLNAARNLSATLTTIIELFVGEMNRPKY